MNDPHDPSDAWYQRSKRTLDSWKAHEEKLRRQQRRVNVAIIVLALCIGIAIALRV